MEITLERLKMIIGDKECQINILNIQIQQLTQAYNKLAEENKELNEKLEAYQDTQEQLNADTIDTTD